jgi:mono/diheme cytochrome c family protein
MPKRRKSMKKLSAIFAGLLLSAAVGIAADTNAGKATYDKSCKMCHGPDGTPNAKIAAAMKVEMQHLGSKEVQGMSDAALKKVVTEGQGKMKPVKTISGADLDNLIAYIRTLKQ